MVDKIDIEGGDITFSQRIEVGEILTSGKSEIAIFRDVMYLLHGLSFDDMLNEMKEYAEYFEEIVKGIIFWINREQDLLKYDPTPEEVQAGVNELSKVTGRFGTIKALANKYSQDPDTILLWKYGKVFMLVWSDLEEFKYKTRYNKIIEKSIKKK